MGGFASFMTRRSIAVIVTLAVILVIIVGLLHVGLCAQIDAKLAEIRQEIEHEIIVREIVFRTSEERKAYIDMRMRQEITKSGLDACV